MEFGGEGTGADTCRVRFDHSNDVTDGVCGQSEARASPAHRAVARSDERVRAWIKEILLRSANDRPNHFIFADASASDLYC